MSLSQDAKCSLCVGLISLAVVAALVLEKLVSSAGFGATVSALPDSFLTSLHLTLVVARHFVYV